MINANVLFLKDVLLPNGKINSTFYENLRNKSHYFVTLITKSIRKYKTLINNEFDNIEFDIENKIFIKSQPYYELLKVHKQLPPKSFNFWSNCFLTFSFETFYNHKLHSMHIAKIKEFLFKIINQISVSAP